MIKINFMPRGRLGNAIFRYMACSILCMEQNGKYVVEQRQQLSLSDSGFTQLLNNKSIKLNKSVNMNDFYQHDYRIYREQIINFINNNNTHVIITDGVNAGDGNKQYFLIKDIVHTPSHFNKSYDTVLHVRLEDFVTHGLNLPESRVICALQKITNISNLCVVCKKPSTDFENNYLQNIKNYCNNTNIDVIFEHNDLMTDYYIMKEATTLICSSSTLSWSGAFFSNKIHTCYFPDYTESSNQSCKKPIDNTILY
jgi:hypothetical protein